MVTRAALAASLALQVFSGVFAREAALRHGARGLKDENSTNQTNQTEIMNESEANTFVVTPGGLRDENSSNKTNQMEIVNESETNTFVVTPGGLKDENSTNQTNRTETVNENETNTFVVTPGVPWCPIDEPYYILQYVSNNASNGSNLSNSSDGSYVIMIQRMPSNEDTETISSNYTNQTNNDTSIDLLLCRVRVNGELDYFGGHAGSTTEERANATTITPTTLTTTTTTIPDVANLPGWCPTGAAEAILADDALAIKRFRVLGYDLKCQYYGEYVLLFALRLNKKSAAAELARGYYWPSRQLRARDITGATALLMAASRGFVEVVDVLVDHGADVTALDDFGRNALNLGAAQVSITAKLLSKLYYPESLLRAQDLAGANALHVALRGGSPASARLLINAAASVEGSPNLVLDVITTRDNAGYLPVHLCGDPETLQLMASHGAALDALDAAGALPLHTAATINGTAINGALNLLLTAANGKVDARDNAKLTPLHYAARNGLAENSDWLLSRGASTSAKTTRGEVPLQFALAVGHWHMLPLFKKYTNTLLQPVVQMGRIDVLKRLVLNESIPADTRDPDTGRGAIFDAVQVGRLDMLQFFVSQGVSLTYTDKVGLTVLAFSAQALQPNATKYLVAQGVPVDQRLGNLSTALHVAAAVDNAPSLEVLLTAGANVSATDWWGRTPLHRSRGTTIAERLLRVGAAAVATVAPLGLLPLHSVARAGHAAVVRLLLTWRHSDVDARDLRGNTALHLAVSSGHMQTAQELLRWCADVQALNLEGSPPSMYARDWRLTAVLGEPGQTPGRCRCDCEDYTTSYAIRASNWRSGCRATVSCLTGSAVEEVRCMAIQSPPNLTARTGVWQPAAPSFGCSVSTSSADRVRHRLAPALALTLAPLGFGISLAGIGV